MIDINLIRKTPNILVTALKNRGQPTDIVKKIGEIDEKWRALKKEEDELRAERNKLGLEISEAKKKGKGEKGGKDPKKGADNADKLIKRSGDVSARIKEISAEVETLDTELKAIIMTIPNIPHSSVPIGKDETHNKEVRKWGVPKLNSKDVLPHDELGVKLGMIDFEAGVKLACHRFSVLKGPLARLERALVSFMLNVQTSRGYLEIAPPHLVNTKSMTGTGQLPKFEEDLYRCRDDDLWLSPTSEVQLTNLFAGEVLDEKLLPVKRTAYILCYRREVGAYGKDIKGLIRQHQFNKVELVKIAHPNNSFEELESLTRDAENILQLLGLPYRVIALCTGDMGFASAKTYDIEVWIPSQDKYREISSCSNCTDFQARRANIKFRNSQRAGELDFVHTLNGSGLAVGRTLIAILENYQDEDGIEIPEPLRDFMGMERIDF